MSVSPSLVLNDTTAAVVAAPTDAPIVGTPARKLASAQGYCWETAGETHAIIERTEVIEAIDAQGDALARRHLQMLHRAAAMARREGAYQTEAMLHERIAEFVRICEFDQHEDDQRRHVKTHAVGATASVLRASAQIGAVLGQHDAVCRRRRPAEGGIEFDPCGQPAGHTLDGKGCVFLARERPANWTAGPNLRRMGAPVGGRAQTPAVSRWSRNHAACVACHRDTVPHAGHGLCRSCYPKHRPQEDSSRG